MKKNKINIIIIIAWSIVIGVFLLFTNCTTSKNNCGTEGQHKSRIKNSKKMAPSMMN